jgi:hypothetical protein
VARSAQLCDAEVRGILGDHMMFVDNPLGLDALAPEPLALWKARSLGKCATTPTLSVSGLAGSGRVLAIFARVYPLPERLPVCVGNSVARRVVDIAPVFDDDRPQRL